MVSRMPPTEQRDKQRFISFVHSQGGDEAAPSSAVSVRSSAQRCKRSEWVVRSMGLSCVILHHVRHGGGGGGCSTLATSCRQDERSVWRVVQLSCDEWSVFGVRGTSTCHPHAARRSNVHLPLLLCRCVRGLQTAIFIKLHYRAYITVYYVDCGASRRSACGGGFLPHAQMLIVTWLAAARRETHASESTMCKNRLHQRPIRGWMHIDVTTMTSCSHFI